MKKDVLAKIKLETSSAFVDAELAVSAKKKGMRIIEVPIAHRRALAKGSGGSLAAILPTVADMVKLWAQSF